MANDARAFPIVGIGASAGGVEALQGLFDSLPDTTGLSFVVLTHLSSGRESLLPQILQRHTAMKVVAAEDGALVEPNVVHVLPGGAVLGFSNGRLRLTENTASRRERKPIDVFLSALAKDVGERAVAIVLSGGDGDGTLGAKAVKERGGLTLAQAPNGHGPAHPSMPESAISSGVIDLAVPVDEMALHLLELTRGLEQLDRIEGEAGQHRQQQEAEVRSEINLLLRNQTGHDFSGYKLKTFTRRVHRRMQINRLGELHAYVELLRREPTEVSALFRDLLINVTNFFRDEEAFDNLAAQVIPKLFEARGADDVVRVWIPGCATGEEVYSIAILMCEHMAGLRNVPRVQIFATDIDDHALSIARGARYPETLLDCVSSERRQRYFVRDGSSYTVGKQVRDMCIFSPHSVLRDPPFSRMDLISCRNLLIYFGTDAQSQVIPIFRYALRPGGFLFLGISEGVGQFGDLFAPVDKKSRIFQARDMGGAPARLPIAISANLGSTAPAGAQHRSPLSQVPIRHLIEGHMLESHTPPHVIVNQSGEILYYSSKTGRYLEAPAGTPSRQLLQLARRGLRVDLRSAMREAVETGRPAVCEGLEFDAGDGRVQPLTLIVEPILADTTERIFVVIFKDNGPAYAPGERDQSAGRSDEYLQLERELRDTRERLQSTVEEYETALEELKASNEELVSVNEELQSTNEELEATKEEQQSLNEELQTVNAELSVKVDALDNSNADLNNLFSVTEIATVFLDAELRIRSFTPAATEVFSIRPADLNRPLTELASSLDFADLGATLHAIVADGTRIDRAVSTLDGSRSYLVRISAYRSAQGGVSGVVVSASDVTQLATAEANLRTLVAELNHRVKNMLAIVQALHSQTRRACATAEDFHVAFSGRISALAGAYELLAAQSWEHISLQQIIQRECAPIGLSRITLPSEELVLAPRQGLSLGLIIHELTTNAIKYGSLSIPEGSVRIDWRYRSGSVGEVQIDWTERDGPETLPQMDKGFGLRLIDREAAYNLGGFVTQTRDGGELTMSICFPQPARSDPVG